MGVAMRTLNSNMKKIIRNIVRCSLAAFVLPAVVSAVTLLEFDFSGSTNTSASNTQASTFTASGIVASSMIRGSGISNNNAGNSFRGTGFSNDGISLTNTDYFQFAVTASEGSLITVDSLYGNFNGTASFSASPGVTMAYAYSLNGGDTFTLMSSFTQVGSGNQTYSIVGADLAALTMIESVVFRLFASGQTTTGGWGLQSAASVGTVGLSVGGSVSSVPEPSTYTAIAGAVVLSGVLIRRRRRTATLLG